MADSAEALPETGRAAIMPAYREPFEMRDFPLPDPEPGAILVRTLAATVCGSDVHVWHGDFADIFPADLPLMLGHEAAGEIVAMGANTAVDSVGQPLKIGDRIIWALESCQHCYQCTIEKLPELCPNRRMGMWEPSAKFPHFVGTFAEYSYVWPGSGRVRIPDDITSEWASAASCAGRTVVNSIELLGHVDYRHSVVVQGAGPLGLFATAFMSMAGPKQLVVVGGPKERLDVARAYGATDVVLVDADSSREKRVEQIKALTGGGADVILEMSGGRTAVSEGFEFAARNARYVIGGTLSSEPQQVPVHLITAKRLTVLGQFSGSTDSYYKAMEAMRVYKDRFDWNLMLSKPYKLDQLTEAMEKMKNFEEIKAVIVP